MTTTRQRYARRIPAIPTEYDKVLYRSRTEARWAAFFDYLYKHGLDAVTRWEPQGFRTEGGNYLPDFLLASQSLIAEVKPDFDADPNGISRWRALIEERGKERGVLLTPIDSGIREFLLIGPDGNGGHWECDKATWLVCPGGCHLDIQPYPDRGCERCRMEDGYWYEDERITKAFDYARSYRFGR